MAKPDTDDFDAAFNEKKGSNAESESTGAGDTGTGKTGAGTAEGSTGTESAGMTAEGATEGAAEAGQTATGTATGDTATEAGTTSAATQAQDEQRMKSWEGRLKARERELNELQAELDAKRAEASANTNVGETQESDDDKSGSGTVSNDEYDKAKSAMVEDFGQDFADNIEKMIKGLLKNSGNQSGEVESLKQQIDDVIAGFQNQFGNLHRSAITDAHEDFDDIVQSPEFQNWCEQHPKKDRIEQICQSGSAGQIIKMLTEFKDSKQVKNASPDNDDAEGVSSGSVLIIPASEGGKGTFDDAWDK